MQSRNRQIDAWRGISILLVIVGHLLQWRYKSIFHMTAFHDLSAASASAVAMNILLRFTTPLPLLGVDIFFVVSGFLITSVLLREERKYGTVSIPAFYARRVFRILPAFLTFLATMAMLSALGLLSIPWRALLGAGLFLCDTRFNCGTWWTGHTWSLAVEEQFYLVWPLAFSILLPGKRARRLMVAYVALVAMSYSTWATQIWNSSGIVGQAFPCIVAGALYACSPMAVQWVDRFGTGPHVLLCAGLLLIQPFFASLPIVEVVLRPIIPYLVAVVFFGSLRKRTVFSTVLSWNWLSAIGLISYSLYLWQQPFTGSLERGGGPVLRWTILCLPIAVISYFMIEKPMIRIGHRISCNIIARSFAQRQRVLASSTAANQSMTLEHSSDQ